MSFADFIDQSVRTPIVLAEISPKEQLTGWSLSSGLTNTYEVSWNDFVNAPERSFTRRAITAGTNADYLITADGDRVQTSDGDFIIVEEGTPAGTVELNTITNEVQGDLYRDITGVTENATSLTEKNNKTEVENNSGTWYFDAANNTLFIHTSDSTNPSEKTVIFVTFKIHIATKGVVFNSIFYEPRIDSDSRISVSMEAEDLFFGDIKKVGTGNLEILNGDGLFDTLSVDWSWKNADVVIRFGGDDLSFSDYSTIGEFEVEDFVSGFETATLKLRDKQKLTSKLIPPNIFTITDFPNMQTDKDGTVIPLLVGSKTNITPILVDSTDQKGQFMICDNALEDLNSIDAVFDDGVQLGASDFDSSLAGCTITILSAYSGTTPSAGDITVNATGPAVLGKAWDTSTDYYKFYGEIIGWLYTQVLGVDDSQIDSTTAKDTDAERDIEQGAYVDTQQEAYAVVRSLEKGVIGRTIHTLDGNISPTLFDPGGDVAALRAIQDPDISQFISDPRIDSIFNIVRVLYDKDPTDDSFKSKATSDDVTKFLRLKNRDVEQEVVTLITEDAGATDTSQRIQFLSEDPELKVRIVESGIRLMDLNVADKIKLTLARAPSSEGSWSQKILEILKIDKTLTPSPEVTVVLGNLKNVGASVGQWTNDAAPDWSSSTEDDKSESGYWTNDSDRADPNDAASEGVSVWF